VKAFRIREWVKSGLVVVPGAITLAALLIAFVARHIDDSVLDNTSFPRLVRGDAASARQLLATIASAAVTLTALVFSITMLVLQLASSQYSPRVLRTFLSDRNGQVTLGVFVGTFVYALAVLRGVDSSGTYDAGLAVNLAVVFAIVAVATFVQYVNHIAHTIRVTSILTRIADDTRAAIAERLPVMYVDGSPPAPPVEPRTELVLTPRAGVVQAVNERALVRAASRADCEVEILVCPGTFVPRGAAIAAVHGGSLRDQAVLDHVAVGRDRTTEQDVAYGLRQLVDIALRALSPSTNDPTTATQALDQLHDLLRDLSHRAIDEHVHRDDGGIPRLRVPEREWQELLDVTLDEIVHHGGTQPQVMRRLRDLLDDLERVAPPARRAGIAAKRATLTG
jgi:uncharacterized membrane protein